MVVNRHLMIDVRREHRPSSGQAAPLPVSRGYSRM